jgi:hypothetical protein
VEWASLPVPDVGCVTAITNITENENQTAVTHHPQYRNAVTHNKPCVNKLLPTCYNQWEEEGDEQEQKETWEFIKQALNEDRLISRPLFP